MKNLKIEFPYVSYETEIHIVDIENHPDPRVRENVRTSMGPTRYHAWHTMHLQGINKPLRIRNKVHISTFLTDSVILGQILGTLIVFVPLAVLVGFLIKFAIVGGIDVFHFIINLFN